MKSKIPLRNFLLTISILGIIFFSAVFFFRADGKLMESRENVPTEAARLTASQAAFGIPFHLKIPSIHIDAVVESVSIAPDGSMDVPQKPDDVAWFDLGPRPGQKGSAVIDGHSGWKDNSPAVFDNLDKLKIGDKIYIEDENQKTATFVVHGFRTFAPEADTASIFSSNDGKAHLNLITCSGVWNAIAQTHASRLVVFTDAE
jgi:LPXTG-site transpeptidase (sortase) family protein